MHEEEEGVFAPAYVSCCLQQLAVATLSTAARAYARGQSNQATRIAGLTCRPPQPALWMTQTAAPVVSGLG